MPTAPDKTLVTFSTTEENKRFLQRKASDEQRSLSNYINTLIEKEKRK